MTSGTSRPWALPPLAGFTVAVTADHSRDEQALLLRQLGASVVMGPCLSRTLDPDGRLREVTEDLVARPPDIVIVTTAGGLRSWLASAAAWGLEEALLKSLAAAAVVARGHKASAGAQAAGLGVAWAAPSTMAEVAEHLLGRVTVGARVAVAVAGDSITEALAPLLERGARVVGVPVYRWSMPSDIEPVRRVVEAVADRRLQGVTFTSAPALRNFLDAAIAMGAATEVTAAFRGGVVAVCVGTVSAAAARDAGFSPRYDQAGRMGPMIRLLSDALVARRRVIDVGDATLTFQGGLALIGGRQVRLAPREAAFLELLGRRPGAVVPREKIVREVWGRKKASPRAVDMLVGRLRRRLGPAGGAITTRLRRGYALDGV